MCSRLTPLCIIPRALLGALLVLLAGCSVLKLKVVQVDPGYQLTHWSFQGKLRAVTPSGHASGFIDWSESDGKYRIAMSGPLGFNSTSIEGTASQVMLTHQGKRYQHATPEQLLKTHLGWDLPVRQLRYWVRGLPDPERPVSWHLDQNQAVKGFVQSNWQVKLSRYQEIAGFWLPHKVELMRSKWRFTLIINQWDTGDALTHLGSVMTYHDAQAASLSAVTANSVITNNDT